MIKIKMGANRKVPTLPPVIFSNLLILKRFLKRGSLTAEAGPSKNLLTIAYGEL
jgi:hypothetical protein